MGKQDSAKVIGTIFGIIASISLGLLAAKILNSLSKPTCPSCGMLVRFGESYCNYCGAPLRWP